MTDEAEVEQVIRLKERLLDVTRNGPVSAWVDRIGEITHNLIMRPEQINWNRSPEHVAFEIVDYMKRYGNLEILERFFRARPQ